MGCRVLVVLLAVVLVHSQVAFDDPCTLTTYVSNFLDKDFVLNVTVPQDCSNGTVNWNYPRQSGQWRRSLLFVLRTVGAPELGVSETGQGGGTNPLICPRQSNQLVPTVLTAKRPS